MTSSRGGPAGEPEPEPLGAGSLTGSAQSRSARTAPREHLEERTLLARQHCPQTAQVAARPPQAADHVGMAQHIATGDAALHVEPSGGRLARAVEDDDTAVGNSVTDRERVPCPRDAGALPLQEQTFLHSGLSDGETTQTRLGLVFRPLAQRVSVGGLGGVLREAQRARKPLRLASEAVGEHAPALSVGGLGGAALAPPS